MATKRYKRITSDLLARYQDVVEGHSEPKEIRCCVCGTKMQPNQDHWFITKCGGEESAHICRVKCLYEFDLDEWFMRQFTELKWREHATEEHITALEQRFAEYQVQQHGKMVDAESAKYRRVAVSRGDRIDPLVIYERDKYRCHICGHEVAMAKRHPHPLAPTIDHVVPLRRGGTHTMDNVKCAHSLCNCVKSDKEKIDPHRFYHLLREIESHMSLRVSAS